MFIKQNIYSQDIMIEYLNSSNYKKIQVLLQEIKY